MRDFPHRMHGTFRATVAHFRYLPIKAATRSSDRNQQNHNSMKLKKYFYLFAASTILLSACSDGDGLKEDFKPTTFNVLGKVEKGPFVSGSTITIQPMDGDLQVLGTLYSSTIQDDLGSFSFGAKLFEAPYAELVANGYFFNEVEGKLSSGTLSLRALVDLSDETTVNVNLLTHLKYQRIQQLIANGMNFSEANKQAQTELFTAFGLQQYAEKDASTFTIAGGTNESAALIAISSLLLVDRSEAALTEYLAKLCREFGQTGTFEESTIQQINEDKKTVCGKLTSVKENIIERYDSLGLNVEVKDLERFIDWDNDGVAGNEVLQEGQEVSLETTVLNVPAEGGVYTVGISSPISVYLEPQFGSGGLDNNVSEEQFFTEIYEETDDTQISMEKSLEGNTLTIKIEPLNSRTSKTSTIPIYDGVDNVVGSIEVIQEGNSGSPIPKLGDTGKTLVAYFVETMAQSMADMNLVEQYYHYNKETDIVGQYVYPSSSTIYNIWNNFYKANGLIMTFKNEEAQRLGVYQEYLDVFSAMQYYYMTVAWGDVPYINYVPNMDNIYIGRTPQSEIFSYLKENLEKAIDVLEEKKNESLSNDANDLFFISKDVARILLANICMYQGDYSQAGKLLEAVINNGFYELDASNYNSQTTTTDLYNNGSGRETIFATKYIGTRRRGSATITTPWVVPIMTYTDVVLSYAECLYKNGTTTEAEQQLAKVTSAKSITPAGSNVLEKIKDARLQLTLYTNTNFAFMKRNGFAEDVYDIEEYRTLLPIPASELSANSKMTQNPGY